MNYQDLDSIEIPMDNLSEEALRGIVEAFVNREGTDYGFQELSFEHKVQQVINKLRIGEAVIHYSPENQDCSIVQKV